MQKVLLLFRKITFSSITFFIIKLYSYINIFIDSNVRYLKLDTVCGIPEVIILDPAGHKTTVPVKMRQINNNRWKCEYVSNLIGLHSVNVFFGGIPVKNSPFGVKIASSKIRKIVFMFVLEFCDSYIEIMFMYFSYVL